MNEESFCFKCGLPDDTANMEELYVPDGDGSFYSIAFHAHPMCQARHQELEDTYNAARLIAVLHELIDEIEAKRKSANSIGVRSTPISSDDLAVSPHPCSSRVAIDLARRENIYRATGSNMDGHPLQAGLGDLVERL